MHIGTCIQTTSMQAFVAKNTDSTASTIKCFTGSRNIEPLDAQRIIVTNPRYNNEYIYIASVFQKYEYEKRKEKLNT